jgi:hypothetical protein
LGGRIELSLKYKNQTNLNEQQIKTAVNASYGGGSANADASTKELVKKLISSSTLNFYIRISVGGPNGYNYTTLPVDLNKGAGGDFIYLNYHYVTSANEAPITEISGFYGQQYSLPSGWSLLPTNIDLNKRAGGDFVYLAIKR